jgi:hypothetical protein
VSDPKATIEALLDNIAVNIDDDSTAASILVHYDGGNDTFKELWDTDDYDVVMELGEGRYAGARVVNNDPVLHQHWYNVKVCTIDKYDASKTLVATGSKMQYKIRSAIEDEIEGASEGSGYTILLSAGNQGGRRISGRYLYEYTYNILYEESQ